MAKNTVVVKGTTPTSVRIPEELKKLIVTEAEKENRNFANMVITILRRHYKLQP